MAGWHSWQSLLQSAEVTFEQPVHGAGYKREAGKRKGRGHVTFGEAFSFALYHSGLRRCFVEEPVRVDAANMRSRE